MCLRNPKEFKVRGKYAYKVLLRKGIKQHLYLAIQGAKHLELERNVWLDEERFRSGIFRRLSFEGIIGGYEPGFHLFTNKKDALAYANSGKGKCCFKVEYKEVRAKGEQKPYWLFFSLRRFNCIVVGKMKIVKQATN